MITKETCVQIWNAHNEIENAQKLIKELAEVLQRDKNKHAPTLDDAFGDKRGLDMGVPTDHNSRRIYNVPFELGVKVIEAHIKAQEKRLEELMAIAKIELYN